MQKFLLIAGATLLIIGLLWPWVEKLGLGRLPGDIAVEKEGLGFYFPVMTSIIISIVLSLLFWLFRK